MTSDDVEHRGRALVTADELARSIASLHVLDLRWRLGAGSSIASYRRGHLPGAVFADLDRDFSAVPVACGPGGRHPLPGGARFTESARRLGVRSDRSVVLYDESGGTSAARGWWVLRYFGHPSVRVLDGGIAAWEGLGLGLEAGDVYPEPGTFSAAAGAMPVLPAGEVLQFAAEQQLLDARDHVRYTGQHEPVDAVAGHIPGAVSVPTGANLDEGGRFLPTAELRHRFGFLLADPGRQVGVYCGSGVTAAHEILALATIGISASLYPGSWSDWISEPSRPIATGES